MPAVLAGSMVFAAQAGAQEPTVTDPALEVRSVESGLELPTGVAFLGRDDFLVLEKASGMVKRVQNGAVTGTVLDLPVNSASERGLLSIALHPRPVEPGEYRGDAERGAGAVVQAPRLALQRSGDGMEVRGRAGRDRVPARRRLGRRYDGDFFVGSARAALVSGNLFRLEVDKSRRSFEFDDRRLRDGVADNLLKYDVTESESLLFGENFGVTPDVQSSPDETLDVVSLLRNAVYEVRRR